MKRFIILLICICAYICLYAQVKTVKPQSIFPVPDITAEQYNSFYQKIDEGKLSRELGRQLEENQSETVLFRRFSLRPTVAR